MVWGSTVTEVKDAAGMYARGGNGGTPRNAPEPRSGQQGLLPPFFGPLAPLPFFFTALSPPLRLTRMERLPLDSWQAQAQAVARQRSRSRHAGRRQRDGARYWRVSSSRTSAVRSRWRRAARVTHAAVGALERR